MLKNIKLNIFYIKRTYGYIIDEKGWKMFNIQTKQALF